MERIDYWTVVRGQGDSLATGVQAVRQSLAGASLPAWPKAEAYAVVGMGASSAAGEFLVHGARERKRLVVNLTAAEYRRTPIPSAACVGVSESGRSPETIDALAAFPGPRIAVTNVPESPITEVADLSVLLGNVADAGVYVSGYTSTLLALAALGEVMGLEGLADGLPEVPGKVAALLPQTETAVRAYVAEYLNDSVPQQIDCVGSGASLASAVETALMMREGCRAHSASFQTDQYLHGPAEATAADSLAVVYGAGRAPELVKRLRRESTHVLFVSSDEAADIRLPEAPALLTCVLEMIVGQILVGRFADLRALRPGNFHYHFEGTKLPEKG